MSQVQLATLAGIHQTQISDLENDEYERTAYVAELAHALGVEAYWLATGKGPRKHDLAASLDTHLLADVLAGVELGCEGRQVKPERRAEMTAAMYRLCAQSEPAPELAQIVQLIRTML